MVTDDITWVKCSTILHVLIFNGLLMVFVIIIHIFMSLSFYTCLKDLFTNNKLYLSLNERIDERNTIWMSFIFKRSNFTCCQFRVSKQWIEIYLLCFLLANYFSISPIKWLQSVFAYLYIRMIHQVINILICCKITASDKKDGCKMILAYKHVLPFYAKKLKLHKKKMTLYILWSLKGS